jgi:hypothetical protein
MAPRGGAGPSAPVARPVCEVRPFQVIHRPAGCTPSGVFIDKEIIYDSITCNGERGWLRVSFGARVLARFYVIVPAVRPVWVSHQSGDCPDPATTDTGASKFLGDRAARKPADSYPQDIGTIPPETGCFWTGTGWCRNAREAMEWQLLRNHGARRKCRCSLWVPVLEHLWVPHWCG